MLFRLGSLMNNLSFPLYQPTLNANPNLEGNSANKSIDNGPAFKENYNIRPVVELE